LFLLQFPSSSYIIRFLPEGVTFQVIEVAQGRNCPLRLVLSGIESAITLGLFHMNAALTQLETRSIMLRVIDSKSQRDKTSLAGCRSEFQSKCSSHFELPMAFEFKRNLAAEIPESFMGHRHDAIGVECLLISLPSDRSSADFVMRKLHFIAGQHGLLPC
jgi:hypothetical protein